MCLSSFHSFKITLLFSEIGLRHMFLDISSVAKTTKINKWDFNKLKIFCLSKENINKRKKAMYLMEEHFANDIA